tara:strand:- start:9 stop:1133 length:1125 start_codon:yes stop_codon:yes gene_type:complete
MLRLDGLKLNDGKLMLKRVPSLPPSERVEFLVNANQDAQMTPVSPAYLAMGFPAGVFTRAFEERHYLDMIMCEAAIDHETKKLFESPRIEDLARGYSVQDELERQQNQQDEIMRATLGNTGFREYEKQHADLYKGLGIGGGHTISDEIERQDEEFKKQYGWGASNSVQDEIERLQAGSVNSFLGGGAAASAFEEMERLRAESENRLGLGAAGSAFDDMIRQRAEFDSSIGAHTARGALEAMEKQQKEFERSLGAGNGGGELENAIRDQMNLNINPFDTLINKEVNRGDGEGFHTPFKKSIFDLPPPEIPPLPKFDQPKLDKTDAVKEEEHKKHIETLAAGQKLYDLQLQAKDEQRERLNSLLDAYSGERDRSFR